jgi:hypothetical protein
MAIALMKQKVKEMVREVLKKTAGNRLVALAGSLASVQCKFLDVSITKIINGIPHHSHQDT